MIDEVVTPEREKQLLVSDHCCRPLDDQCCRPFRVCVDSWHNIVAVNNAMELAVVLQEELHYMAITGITSGASDNLRRPECDDMHRFSTAPGAQQVQLR
jgi:hypothetical protein